MSIDFSRKLIKGRIAEVIFEQMIRAEGRYTIIPFGYEHTIPTLSQYRGHAQIKSIIDNIADAPDFALISEDKTKIYLVEVKYQYKLDLEKVKEYAKELSNRWEYPWLFIATSNGFYCGMSRDILDNGGLKVLPESWVTIERQEEYLKLLNEFKDRRDIH